MKPSTGIGLTVAATVLFLLTLFWIQNSSRTTQLSIDLGFGAWIGQPLQIPVLMLICILSGFMVGAGIFGWRGRASANKARRLEQELALSGGSSDDGWK